MATKAKLGAGNVEFTLDGETVVLRPTLKAAQALSRRSGGFSELISEVSKLDLDAVTTVVAYGLDRQPKDVADAVWRTGLPDLVGPTVEFIGILANGGRRVEEADGGEGEADPQGK